MCPVAEMKIFPYVLPNLRVQNPDLKIELFNLNNLEQIRAMKKGELDISFSRHNFHNEEFESKFVLREPLIVLLPKDHPLAKHERIPVKALNAIDFIIPAEEQSSTLHNTILEFAKHNNIELNIVQKADNILLNINSVGAGLGCTILPSYIAPLTTSNTVIRPLDIEAALSRLVCELSKKCWLGCYTKVHRIINQSILFGYQSLRARIRALLQN